MEGSDEEIIQEAVHLMNLRHIDPDNYNKGANILNILVNKGCIPAILQRAAFYNLIENNEDKAKELWEKIGNTSSEAALSLGIAYKRLCQYEKAKDYFLIAKKLGSSSVDYRLDDIEEYLK